MYKTLSKNSLYFVPKNRYRELKYFCLQYSDFKKELASINLIHGNSILSVTNDICTSNPIANIVEHREKIIRNIKLIEDTAYIIDNLLAPYIIRGVTTGKSYDILNAIDRIPTNRQKYYLMLRQFFCLLDKKK